MKVTKNLVSLVYRIAASALILAGVLWLIFGTDGTIDEETGEAFFQPAGWSAFLYYTILSNILAFGVFVALFIKMVRPNWDKRNLLPVIEGGSVAAITLTLVVFWAILAPGTSLANLFTFHNMSVHMVAPVLLIIDFFVFTERGSLRRGHIWWWIIFPIAYLIFASVVGFLGVEYKHGDKVTNFPYGFMDYHALGFGVIPWFVGIAAFYVGLSFLVYYLDSKLANRSKPPVKSADPKG
ncbi:MAG: Pr6Pr family membrane protein [Christensenellaceae bacterium]|jgi:hypothetical protein|nr:Pr6Pr family membrane protein [Christensenellaceae bacterium]